MSNPEVIEHGSRCTHSVGLDEVLDSPSIQTIKERQTVNCATTKENWMTPIIQYLKDGVLQKDKRKVRLLRFKAVCYTM